MSKGYKMVVLMKQVPDTSSKAGVNPDGTVDRARAKKMLNTFDKFALQKALEVREVHGGEIIVATMGPPPAKEILIEALEYGADKGYLLSDKRLAASDTLATAYALHMVVRFFGDVDIVFTGLQTTDGDTAQVGPQIAERLDIPQITYLEKLEVKDGFIEAERVIEGGMQKLKTSMPALITVANSAKSLEHKKFYNVFKTKELRRNEEEFSKRVITVNLDDINADPAMAGLVGSPTIVSKTWKLGEKGGSCVVFKGEAASVETQNLMDRLIADKRGIEELVS